MREYLGRFELYKFLGVPNLPSLHWCSRFAWIMAAHIYDFVKKRQSAMIHATNFNVVSACEGFNLTIGLEVISSPWRCSRSLVIKMVQKIFKEISKERKIKEILFKYFITKLSRPSKQWTLFSSCYKFISPKQNEQKRRLKGITKQ